MDNKTDFFYNENGITSEGEAVAQAVADEELTDKMDKVSEPEATEASKPDLNEIESKITDFEDRLIKLEEELLLLMNSKNKKSKDKKKAKVVDISEALEKPKPEKLEMLPLAEDETDKNSKVDKKHKKKNKKKSK